MSNKVPTISTTLKFSAFGATLAMLPMAILATLNILLKVDINESTAEAIIAIQVFGCLIWGATLLGANGNARLLQVSDTGLTLCAVGVFIGGLIQLLFLLSDDFKYKLFEFVDYNGERGFGVMILLTAASNLPIFIGALLAGSKLHALRNSAVNYLLLGLYPLILRLIAELLFKNVSYSTLKTYFIIITLLLFTLCLTSVIAWWKASGDASELEDDYEDDDEEYITETTYVEQPSTPSPSSQSAPSPSYPAPGKSAPVTPEQKQLIMGMSDEELTKVINNPTLYANQAFVEEARATLTKRQAWEMIKDYSDAQLLDIVHNNTQGFAYEVLDASSMELLARETEEFVNEVRNLDTESLQGIVTNPGNYFDGYVRLATRVLSERLNPGSNQQPGAPA